MSKEAIMFLKELGLFFLFPDVAMLSFFHLRMLRN